jgi:pimeloyl-ACP methyl ester carboxylesterase
VTRFSDRLWKPLTRFALSVCAFACTLAAPLPASAGELVQIPVRAGQTQGIYIDQPAAAPPWVIVLFAGDQGVVALNGNGPSAMQGNFVIRTAGYWTSAGDAIAIVDAPSDQSSGMNDAFRLSEAHAADLHAAVAALRQRFPAAKIALLGTSRGTISVGNVLKREPQLADAYVLSSPVTISARGEPGLSGMHWDVGATPVLVVSNENDSCRVSPFSAARALAEDSHLRFLAVSSSERGGIRANECGAKSPHGFLGIENQVLSALSQWLSDPASVGILPH